MMAVGPEAAALGSATGFGRPAAKPTMGLAHALAARLEHPAGQV
jgi:hypothetical protein